MTLIKITSQWRHKIYSSCWKNVPHCWSVFLFITECLFWMRGEIKTVFTREISSQDETRPGMKSSLSVVKCLLLFTCFCRDKISSRDELIPVKKAGMKFHLGMKKRSVNTSSADEILQQACFYLIFDACTQHAFQLWHIWT